MQLQKQFSDDLIVITLNVDFDGEGKPSQETVARISQTLADQNINCVNYIASTPMEEVLSKFEFFGLPAAVLYDRAGDSVETFDGEVDIENTVKPTYNSERVVVRQLSLGIAFPINRSQQSVSSFRGDCSAERPPLFEELREFS